jgi:4-amino-4-deoxy-L-arabinose transferase-like glycosyltransferase
VVLLVLVALVVRLVWWLLLTPDYVPDADDAQYLELARNLADGKGFALQYPGLEVHPTAFRPPAYPLLLGASQWLFGPSIVVGRLLNLLLGLGVVLLGAEYARRAFGARVGVLVGLLLAVYPPLVANDVVLLSEPLGQLLLLAVLLSLHERRWALAGLFAGLSVLTRPSAQALVVLLVLWVLWRVDWRAALRLGVVAVLVVAPWVVRNVVQVDTVGVVSSNGFTAAAVYGPAAQERGQFVDPTTDPAYDGTAVEMSAFDEGSWNDQLVQLALDGLADDPSHVLHVVGDNALEWFELQPSRGEPAERKDGRNLTARRAALPLFYLVTLTGVAGLWLRRRELDAQLLALVGVYFTAMSLVLVAPPRLRAPVDLVLVFGCAVFASWVVDWWRGRRGPDDDGAERPIEAHAG